MSTTYSFQSDAIVTGAHITPVVFLADGTAPTADGNVQLWSQGGNLRVGATGQLTLATATLTYPASGNLVTNTSVTTFTNKTIVNATAPALSSQTITNTATANQVLLSNGTTLSWTDSGVQSPSISGSTATSVSSSSFTNMSFGNSTGESGSILFPGSSTKQISRVTVNCSITSDTGQFRLQDVQNGNQLAIITPVTNGTYSTTTITNVSANPARLQIQGRRLSGSGTLTLNSYMIS